METPATLKELRERELMKYKRILLKLSGEVFGKEKQGLDHEAVEKIASELQKIHQNTGIEMAIVVGAGNLFRARFVKGTGVDRVVADHIGMLGTLMNALALQEAMERMGNNTRVMSAFEVKDLCEPFIRRRAIRHLEKGRIVILGGGTGNPYFTTDSAAALRSIELKCHAILKASVVDGVYDKDPRKYPDAQMYKKISYQEVLERNLGVMDSTAFALCQKEKMPIIIFNINNPSNIEKVIQGEKIGTLIN